MPVADNRSLTHLMRREPVVHFSVFANSDGVTSFLSGISGLAWYTSNSFTISSSARGVGQGSAVITISCVNISATFEKLFDLVNMIVSRC
jgi:hypothetical protein